MKHIHIILEDAEYKTANRFKGKISWKDVLMGRIECKEKSKNLTE